MDDDQASRPSRSGSWTASSSHRWLDSGTVPTQAQVSKNSLSPFECIILTHPPIFESLLLHLPTSSILDLYHTSRSLQTFLQDYPTAWNNLSFRSLSPGRLASRQTSPASDGSGDLTNPQSKQYALDQLFNYVILPFGTRLRSLTLDHTAVSGHTLITHVLHGRRETLQHLSVRGCKQVSLKYHIVPFLNLFNLQARPRAANQAQKSFNDLALRSLYTFRCRHHRRRPYTPASLLRRDSDSLPTDDLIRICHTLGIWVDSAWCPTPGGRCMRRKDYSVGRGTPDARFEVWVVYDRLWRSGNRLGHSAGVRKEKGTSARGQLWEDAESGYNGEPLGCESRPGQGEGKLPPAHLRQSHIKFVEDIKCYDCGTQIHERCEHCSIRMHCMGCRKTLCASCAFARPLPKIKQESEEPEKFWWAPGQARKPEIMMQEHSPTASSDPGNFPNSTITPAVNLQWCCLKPMFSNGGSITFVGPSMKPPATNHIRTSPLPKGAGYEDPEFLRLRSAIDQSILPEERPDPLLDGYVPKGRKQILDWIMNGPGSKDGNLCPRSLCHECWDTPGWRAACKFCKEPFCVAHDLRGLSVRICGYKDLTAEKAFLEESAKFTHIIEDWIKKTRVAQQSTHPDSMRTFNAVTLDKLHELIATLPDGMWQRHAGQVLRDEIVDLVITGYPECPSEKLYSLQSLESEKPPPTLREGKDEVTEDPDSKSDSKEPWRGCKYIMCPRYRSIGDHRPRCTAAAKQCTLCDIHICPECLVDHPACDCSYCKDNYTCPNCFHKREHTCRKAEEEEQKKMKSEKIEFEKALAARKLMEADVAVQRAGEFMAAMSGEMDMEDTETLEIAKITTELAEKEVIESDAVESETPSSERIQNETTENETADTNTDA